MDATSNKAANRFLAPLETFKLKASMMNCPACGQSVPAGARQCPFCGRVLEYAAPGGAASPNPFADTEVYDASIVPPPSRPLGDDPALRMVIPVGQSPLAIISGYAGLLSLAICPLGPIAIVCGALAIRQIRRNPNMHGTYRAVIGIVLGIIGTLGLVAAVLVAISEQ